MSSSTLPDLVNLTLLPFLSSTASPALLLTAAPLRDLLVSSTDKPTRHTKRSRDEYKADGKLGAAAEAFGLSSGPTTAGGSGNHHEGDPSSTSHLLAALQPVWANESWEEMARLRGTVSPSQFESATTESTAMEWHDLRAEGAELSMFRSIEQLRLLRAMLDILERSKDDGARLSATVNLGATPATATLLLPDLSHFVVMLSMTGPATPALPTSGSARGFVQSSPYSRAVELRAQQQPFPPLKSPPLRTATMRDPMRDVRGTQQTSAPRDPSREPQELSNLPKMVVETEQTSHEAFLRSMGTSFMADLIRQYPWHTTSLGALKDWTPELKAMTSYILHSPFRKAILYGEDLCMIYNDAYASVAGNKHPALLGAAAADGWKEIWDDLDPIARRVLRGETYHVDRNMLIMRRFGFAEETYFQFAWTPFADRRGNYVGFVNVSIDTTAQVISERRLGTARDLVQMSAVARSVDEFCTSTLACIEKNPLDIPFFLLYSCEVSKMAPTQHVRAGQRPDQTSLQISLKGSVGLPVDHPFRVKTTQVSLRKTSNYTPSLTSTDSDSTSRSESNRWAWAFEEACSRREPVFIEDLGIHAQSIEDRGWEEKPKHAVVMPTYSETGQQSPTAFLIVGVYSQGQYNADYQAFLQLISRHIGIGLLAVTNAEADMKRTEELIALDRAKTSFFQNISHELRTPLTLILGPLEDVIASRDLSGRDVMSKANRDRLTVVKRHANRLVSMVNKLLDFSSLEAGRVQTTYRPVQLHVVTRNIATMFRDAVERDKIRYEVICDPDPPRRPPMYIATDLWEKIMFNLIGNAFKYCRAGAIEVRLKQTSKEAVLSVSDTGIGIPQDELSKIFDRFHRIESTSKTISGTGIGLALTLECIKLLGATLDVQSELGNGSTFSVRVPRGYAHLPANLVVHEPETMDDYAFVQRNSLAIEEAASWRYDNAVHETASAASHSSSSADDSLASGDVLNLRNSTVLLVEDNNDLRNYLVSILSKLFTVVACEDGQAALEHVRTSPPSLIVSDITMPRLDGFGLLKELRKNVTTANIPIIFLSARAGVEARSEALEAGGSDYLVKPFQARELVARVQVHLQLARMQVELERRVEERTRALVESETAYRDLYDRYSTLSVVSPVGVFLVNPSGETIYANPRFYEIAGHSPEAPLTSWFEEVVPKDRARLQQTWQEVISAGPDSEAQSTGHVEIRFKKGTHAQFEIRAFQDVRSQDGFVGAITDVTAQKELELAHLRAVENRAAEAEEQRRAQDVFVDVASHELRNPLSACSNNAEVLRGSIARLLKFLDNLKRGHMPDSSVLDEIYRSTEEDAEAVEAIILSSSHQAAIASDILNVSKLNLGLLSINLVPFSVSEKVLDLIRMFEAECQQKSIEMSLSLHDSVAANKAEWVNADPFRIAQVLINFLTNSIKYTVDSERKKIVIRVEAFASQPPLRAGARRVVAPTETEDDSEVVWLAIGVEDSGRGLAPEELDKLFARFSQARPRTDQYGGSGLGLYVSRKLTELHHGFIEVESQVGVGSIFRLGIPARRAVHPSTATGDSSAPTMPLSAMFPGHAPLSSPPLAQGGSNGTFGGTSSPTEPLPLIAGRAIRVLVVEDNLINQRVLKRQLNLAKYEVQVANNGQEALDLLVACVPTPDKQPDVVLMDIEMPVKNGLTALRELRQLELEGKMPRRYNVIAVTGNARQGQIDEFLRSGFDACSIKPYDFKQLLKQIQHFTVNLHETEAMIIT